MPPEFLGSEKEKAELGINLMKKIEEYLNEEEPIQNMKVVIIKNSK